jgi:hypothetical protein
MLVSGTPGFGISRFDLRLLCPRCIFVFDLACCFAICRHIHSDFFRFCGNFTNRGGVFLNAILDIIRRLLDALVSFAWAYHFFELNRTI